MMFHSDETPIDFVNNTPLPSDNKNFDELIESIKKICGVDIAPKRDIIMRRLGAYAKSNGINTFGELDSKLHCDSNTKQEILNIITVNETYFYRELAQLKEIVTDITDMGGARVLCAPCSSGEEVYSIAMLAHERGIDPASLEIVGIDINSQVISQCNSGIYKERSLHRLNNFQISRFFYKIVDKFQIRSEILAKCDFRICNIFDDAIYRLGKFDLIVSRNMMIYFDEEFRLKCIERLHKLLNPYGRVYVGHADIVPYTPLFEKKFNHITTFYEKIEM
ncbi:MAG: protein-glutamate O-methyltransferase CheR [Campylobacter sp.]|nr:protein-glutamate O-methyltransferase CheR [Campylobacter sp.]